MTLIDWSDPDEMLGLLIEYVADEAVASHEDPERAAFLRHLSRELDALASNTERVEQSLREVIDEQPREFANDPVLEHLEACIEELQRIRKTHSHGERSSC
jgi:hypothetical protein